MQLKSSFYMSKYSGPKIAHHSNLTATLGSTIEHSAKIAKIMVWTDYIDQFTILDFWFGLDLNAMQFSSHYILDLETWSGIFFTW